MTFLAQSIQLEKNSTLASPNTGYIRLYVGIDNQVYCRDSSGSLSRVVYDSEAGSISGSLQSQITTFAPNSLDMGYDIILCAGQSNMAGRGTLDSSIDVTTERIYQYGGVSTDSRYQTVYLAADGLSHPEGIRTTSIGPSMSFARNYISQIPATRRVLLVPVAWGGTALATASGPWNPSAGASPGTAPSNAVAGSLYENAISQANKAIATAQIQFPNSRFVGTIWIQGETDGDNAISQNAYATALDTLIAGFRSRITGASTSWFIIGQMLPDGITLRSNYQTINAAHIDTLQRNTRIGFAYGIAGSSYQNGDNLHYNAAGDRIIGTRMSQQVNAAKANTSTSLPVPPSTAPTVTSLSTSSVRVSWDAPLCRVTDYVINYRVSPNGAWNQWAHTASPGRTTTITGLSSIAYDFAIQSINGFGTSSFSPTTTLTPVAIPPGQVTGLSVTSTTSTSVSLSWLAPSTGGTVTNYLVEYRINPSGTWLNTSTASTSITISSLTTGTTYDFRVTAQNSGGSGSVSSIVTATAPITPPGTVTNLNSTGVGSSSVSLSWTTPVSGATVTDYLVQNRINPNGTWTTFPHAASTSTTISVTGLVSATTYDFQVAAAGISATFGPFSNTVTAITTGTLAAPSQVTSVNITSTSTSSVILSWSAPGGGGTATSYLVEYRTNPSGTWTAGATTYIPTTTATITGLSSATTYDFRVTAQNSTGNALASPIVTGSTSAPLLQDIVGIAPLSAYSPFKLCGNYNGSCWQVQRSSDSTTQDIGFTSQNQIDTTSLLSFVGSNNGFTSKIYDQSTFGYHLAPYTAIGATAPQVVVSGALVGFAGGALPAINWDGRASGSRKTGMDVVGVGSNIAGSDLTLFAVIYPTNTTSSGTFTDSMAIFSGTIPISTTGFFMIQLRTGSPWNIHIFKNNGGGGVSVASTTNTPIANKTAYLLTMQYTDSTKTYVIRLNGTQVLSWTDTVSNINTDVAWGCFNSNNTYGKGMIGHMPEFMIFPALTLAQIQAAEANIRSRWGF